MNLKLLDFDVTEDAEGVVCWDALACPGPEHNPALLQEVTQVLVWAWRFAAQGPGPLEDGADWDFDLQATLHIEGLPPAPFPLRFDPDTGSISSPLDLHQKGRIELSLSLSATPGFAQAFREQFDLP